MNILFKSLPNVHKADSRKKTWSDDAEVLISIALAFSDGPFYGTDFSAARSGANPSTQPYWLDMHRLCETLERASTKS